MADDTLTDDDRARLTAIMQTIPDDPIQGVTLLHDYYRDADRADRTSRATMYLHLGLLSGVILRLHKPDSPS
jgi:hypothetical protein